MQAEAAVLVVWSGSLWLAEFHPLAQTNKEIWRLLNQDLASIRDHLFDQQLPQDPFYQYLLGAPNSESGRSRSLRRGVRGGSPEGTRCRSQESQASQGSKASQESQGSKASQESPPGGQPRPDASDICLAEYPCGTRKFVLFQRQPTGDGQQGYTSRGWNLWTPGLPRNVRARLNRRWRDLDIDDSDRW